jgi:hypothetical protein
MTDKPVPTPEEEASIREQIAFGIARDPKCATLWPALVLNALDAARAKAEEMRQARDDAHGAYIEASQDLLRVAAEVAAVDAILDEIQMQPNNGEPARRLRNLVYDRDDWREMALKGRSAERVIVPREGTRQMIEAWSAAHRAGGDPSECLAAALKAGEITPPAPAAQRNIDAGRG